MNKNERALKLLETFPELSDKLAEELRLRPKQYILINSKGEAHCTACQETFTFNAPEPEKQEEPDTSCYCTQAMIMMPPKHRETTTCPKCGRIVEVIKNWHNFNGYTLEDSDNVVIFLTGKNKTLYARCYRTETYFEKGKLAPIRCCKEVHRYVFTENEVFRYGRSYYDNKWELRKKAAHEPVFTAKCDNMYWVLNKQVINKSCLKYSACDLYKWSSTFSYLCFYMKHKGAERLIKCGFAELIRDMSEPWTYYSSRHVDPRIVNWKETEPHKMLRLSKEAFDAIRQKRIDFEEYKIILREFPDAPLEKLIVYNKIIMSRYELLDQAVNRSKASQKEVLKYLTKQWKRSSLAGVQYYNDYLEMCAKLKYDFNNRVVVFPKDLVIAHDRVNDILTALRREEEERRRIEIAKMRKEQLKKNQTEFESHMEERRPLEFEYGRFIVVQPKNLSEIIDEGGKLSHCVGGYAERHAAGVLHIMFLRNKEDPETPFYTIEVSTNGKIVQCRGYQNNVRIPKPQEVSDFEKLYQSYLNGVFAKKNKKARKTA